MRTHELKCNVEFFQSIVDDEKTFEIRFNDRGFQRGDSVHLREYDPGRAAHYTGRRLTREITYVLNGCGLKNGYVALALAKPS